MLNRLIAIGVVICLAMVCVACPGSDYADRDELKEDLNRLYIAKQKQDEETIVDISNKILKSKKTLGTVRLPALIYLAEVKAGRGKIAEVKRLFDNQFKSVMKSTGACSLAAFVTIRGDVWRDTGHDDLAVTDYRLAIEKCPKIDNAYSKLSLIYSSSPDAGLFNPDEALVLAREAFKVRQGARAYGALATAYAAMHQYRLAVENMKLALSSAEKEHRSIAEMDGYRKLLADYESKLAQ